MPNKKELPLHIPEQQTLLFDDETLPFSSSSNSPSASPSSASPDFLSPQVTVLEGGKVVYFPQWLQQYAEEFSFSVEHVYQQLKDNVQWEQSEITLYGKTMRIPRLNAWYGDKQCGYRYSGKYFPPLPWLPELLEIQQAIHVAIEQYAGTDDKGNLNSVLVNCYRHGQDSVAWHSDDEPELGINPMVASLSLGGSRKFQMKHRHHSMIDRKEWILNHGDLLLMVGATQHNWHHQIPKTRQVVQERINLTFRHVQANHSAS